MNVAKPVCLSPAVYLRMPVLNTTCFEYSFRRSACEDTPTFSFLLQSGDEKSAKNFVEHLDTWATKVKPYIFEV